MPGPFPALPIFLGKSTGNEVEKVCICYKANKEGLVWHHPPAPLFHLKVESTSFDEEPILSLEDSKYLSQTGQSISLEPFPPVSLETGSIEVATTTFHGTESVLSAPVKAK